eukprot:764468-Hanusia_phi.AAC.2
MAPPSIRELVALLEAGGGGKGEESENRRRKVHEEAVRQSDPLMGMTVAHVAAMTDKQVATQALLDLDRSLFAMSNRSGHKPSHLAAMKGNSTILTMMARALDISRDMDDIGNTPFHYAAMHACSDTLAQLLDLYPHGARTRNHHGDSPLHLAVMNGSGTYQPVRYLLQKDPALLAIRNNHGRTAAHMAAGAGNLQLMQVFYETDRHCLECADITGCLPCHFSAANGQKNVLEWMQQVEAACLQVKDREGLTCYDHAKAHSQVLMKTISLTSVSLSAGLSDTSAVHVSV